MEPGDIGMDPRQNVGEAERGRVLTRLGPKNQDRSAFPFLAPWHLLLLEARTLHQAALGRVQASFLPSPARFKGPF